MQLAKLLNHTSKNQLPNITNTQNDQLDNKKQDLNISLENNPLLPIVITLSSVILLVFCGACCNWLYNKRKLKKISCNKSDKNRNLILKVERKRIEILGHFLTQIWLKKNYVLWNNSKKQVIEGQRKRH